MTKFKVKPFSEYEKHRNALDMINDYIEKNLKKIDSNLALILLAKKKSIWTVDTPGNNGEFRLVNFTMTSSKEMVRNVPNVDREDDVAFMENVNLIELLQVQWFASNEDFKSLTGAPKKNPSVKKEIEGEDYILMFNETAKREEPVRVGAHVYLPEMKDGSGGGFFLLKKILGKNTIVVPMLEGDGSLRVNDVKIERDQVKDKWYMSQSPAYVGQNIVGIHVIENYFHEPNFFIYAGDKVLVEFPEEAGYGLPKDGSYRVSPQEVTVQSFASDEEIIANISALNLNEGVHEEFRIVVHTRHIKPVQEQGEKE